MWLSELVGWLWYYTILTYCCRHSTRWNLRHRSYYSRLWALPRLSIEVNHHSSLHKMSAIPLINVRVFKTYIHGHTLSPSKHNRYNCSYNPPKSCYHRQMRHLPRLEFPLLSILADILQVNILRQFAYDAVSPSVQWKKCSCCSP